MEANEIIAVGLALLGAILILLGAGLSVREWNAERRPEIRARKDALGKQIGEFRKLVEAIRTFKTGMQLVILGIVILFIALAFYGLA